jgi:hypothetical protein
LHAVRSMPNAFIIAAMAESFCRLFCKDNVSLHVCS